MARRLEFWPRTRQGQLDMGGLWLTALPEETKDAKGVTAPKWKVWGMPEADFIDFGNKYADALEALTDAKDKGRNSDVVNERVKDTFAALETCMRSLKRRFFHVPPLTNADLVSLGLRAPSGTHVVTGSPTAQVIVEISFVGRHQLRIRLRYVSGDPYDKANKGFRIRYQLVGHGEEAPARPEDLPLDFPERRKLFTRDFGPDASGKTIYFSVQIENGKYVGPFGPMSSAIIP